MEIKKKVNEVKEKVVKWKNDHIEEIVIYGGAITSVVIAGGFGFLCGKINGVEKGTLKTIEAIFEGMGTEVLDYDRYQMDPSEINQLQHPIYWFVSKEDRKLFEEYEVKDE